ncbi:general odorant-binding protein 19d-like [Lycorma delicatula]|uniref:general odorant-binding protein 19d-like n=1 Tax=Lycorma delicatula TaxID=130591 RepID=UPI003F518B43
MKCIVFIVSSLLAVQIQYASAAPRPDKEKFLEIFEKCRQKENVDEVAYESLRKKQLPKTDKGKCMVACMFEETGLIKDNVLNKDSAVTLAKTMFGDQAEKLEKAKEIIETCDKEVGQSDGNKCEFAFKIAECAKMHGGDTIHD